MQEFNQVWALALKCFSSPKPRSLASTWQLQCADYLNRGAASES